MPVSVTCRCLRELLRVCKRWTHLSTLLGTQNVICNEKCGADVTWSANQRRLRTHLDASSWINKLTLRWILMWDTADIGENTSHSLLIFHPINDEEKGENREKPHWNPWACRMRIQWFTAEQTGSVRKLQYWFCVVNLFSIIKGQQFIRNSLTPAYGADISFTFNFRFSIIDDLYIGQ